MTTARPLAAASHDPGIDQRKASDPSVCAWVNASAGSGKTKVLTDRVMRLLLSGVRPEKILCLTYTRAGAAEMANRITGMLAKWAVCNDPELSEDIDKLQNRPMDKDQLPTARRLFAEVLACPGGLRIRTIHSFCQEILSRFPLEAGLPPHFALIEEQELAVLKTGILNGMLREAADEPGGNLAKSLDALVAAQGETGFAKMLKEATHEIRRLTPAQNALKTMMAKTRSFLSIDETDTPDKICRATIDAIPEATLRPMADWLSNGSTRYSPRGKKMRAFFELPPKNRLEHFDEYCGFFLKDDLTSFADSFIASKDIRTAHPEIDDLHKTEVQRLRSALQQIEAAEIAQTTKCVLYFGLEFSRRLAGRKASRAAVDYDDLILFTENLLRKSGIAPWILYKLDNGLEHILLDESQDTSLAQWSIVESLTGEFFSGEGAQPERTRTLFVVGDEKQSIFSFQGADPQAFLSRRDYFLSRARAAQKTFENVSMQTSFRSAARVLEAVDAVFEQEAAQISPSPIAHRAYPNPDGTEKLGRVELWPLIEKPKAEKTSSTDWIPTTTRETEYDPETELTQAIAQKIKGWLTRRET
ncbi:MAG: UvrD-helicase domain-containing protein, partial [Alphaproteobacteria bacterium]|nr:UvrD-helicase domain-containing protein [Alphaproteobacteria bacterium]